jgi:hypothetical protein
MIRGIQSELRKSQCTPNISVVRTSRYAHISWKPAHSGAVKKDSVTVKLQSAWLAVHINHHSYAVVVAVCSAVLILLLTWK